MTRRGFFAMLSLPFLVLALAVLIPVWLAFEIMKRVAEAACCAFYDLGEWLRAPVARAIDDMRALVRLREYFALSQGLVTSALPIVMIAVVIFLTGCQKFDPKDGADLWFGINVGALFVIALAFALGGIFMLHKEYAALRMLFVALFALGCFALLTACADTINPVRYQTVEVLVTRPCLAGKTPPAQAVVLTDPVCTLPTNAECVRAAAADIAELQREARESRNLIRECSK
jgi:hypothetical protein